MISTSRAATGNAFTLEAPATVYISTGVIHHFRGPDLAGFLRPQTAAWAFAHWDIAQTWLARAGAWIFHQARMREPLSRHDGVLSAMRAYDDETLLRAARAAAPSMRAAVFHPPNRWLPIFRVLRPLVGFRAELEEPLRAQLGARARRLEGLA